MLNLYYIFWIIFVFFVLLFLFLKFFTNFFKVNGIKSFFQVLFQRNNRFILFTLILFSILFWFSFYTLFYQRSYPSFRITEHLVNNEINTSSCILGDNCNNLDINISYQEEILIDVVDYSRNYVTFKVNKTMYLKECENCNLNILYKDKEYKLKLNDSIYLEVIDNDINNKVYYLVELNK